MELYRFFHRGSNILGFIKGLVDCTFDWLIDCMYVVVRSMWKLSTPWSIIQRDLFDWLIDYLITWLLWVLDFLSDWLIDWLIDWL